MSPSALRDAGVIFFIPTHLFPSPSILTFYFLFLFYTLQRFPWLQKMDDSVLPSVTTALLSLQPLSSSFLPVGRKVSLSCPSVSSFGRTGESLTPAVVSGVIHSISATISLALFCTNTFFILIFLSFMESTLWRNEETKQLKRKWRMEEK